METFDFCPGRYVPENLPREAPQSTMSMNAWQFSARPTTPYQRKFKLTLHGMYWYLNLNTDFYDELQNPKFNARRLERFYEIHETWKPFLFTHQHFGYRPMECRFASVVTVPAGVPNSGGYIAPFEVQLIQHNPGYTS